MTTAKRVIFHVDMDAFFAAIEQRDNPAYRIKPVIVGARPGTRGVVSAASYEARTYGIHSAMPINQAHARCPHGVFLRPNMEKYRRESHHVMEVLSAFSPVLEQISVDEAFLDMSGAGKLWGAPVRAAQTISRRIKEDLNLTASIGIAPNKFLAKLASDYNKPDGITETPFTDEAIRPWLAPLAVSRIWGVGARAQQALAAWGVHTIGDLQRLSRMELEQRFGKAGESLFELSRGIDSRPVGEYEQVKSISREHTFSVDSTKRREWESTLLSLARDVAFRARRKNVRGSTVVLSWRTPDFQRHSRRITLSQPTNLANRIYREVLGLLDKETNRIRALRLIGVGITNFREPAQTNLFEQGSVEEQAWKASESAMDLIVMKYGESAIFLAGERKGRGND